MNAQVQVQFVASADAGSKFSAFDMHPNRPWVACGTDQGQLIVYDYFSRLVVHRYSILNLEEKERNLQLLQQMLERDPNYKGPKSITNTKPAPPEKKKMGSIQYIKFVDQDVRIMKREIERLGSFSTQVKPLEISPSLPRLIIAIGEYRILAFDYISFSLQEIDLAVFDNKAPQCLEVFSKEDLVIFGGTDGCLYLWDVVSWSLHQKISTGHSKPIMYIFTHYEEEEDVTTVATLSSDGFFCKFVMRDGKLSLESKLEAKPSVEVQSATINPTELQILVATDRGVLIRSLRQNTENRLIKMKQTFNELKFYMHPRLPRNSLLMLLKDSRSLYTSTIANLEDGEPITVFTLSNLPLPIDPKTKLISFGVHSMHSHRIALITPTTIAIVNFEKQRTPNFALIPGSPSKIYYGTDQTIYTISSITPNSASSQSAGAQTQMYAAVHKLSMEGEVELRISSCYQFVFPCLSYLSILFLEKQKYQILSTKTWKVLEEGSATQLVWSQKAGDDRFALVEVQYEDQRPKDKKGDEKKRKDTVTSVPVSISLTIHTKADGSVKPIMGNFGTQPPVIYGGFLLGVGTRSASLSGESTSTMQFYTWDGEPIGPSLPAPIAINWDPTGKYCLFIFEEYFCIFSARPNFKLLAKISDVIISSIWYNQCLFYSSISADIKCFFVHQYDCQEVLLSTTSREAYESSQLPLDARNKMGFIGAISLVEVVDNNLVVIDSDFTLSSIKFNIPQLFFYCLSHTGDINEALKWVDKIPTKEHPSLARFLEARGYASKILSLDIPVSEKLAIFTKKQLFEDCVVVIREMVDDFLKSSPNNRELKESILSRGIKAAQLATKSTNFRATMDMYRELARLDQSVYKQLVIHLAANSMTDELMELYQQFVEQSQFNEAKFVAMFLDETLYSEFLRSGTEYSEAVQYFWAADREFAMQKLNAWNKSLEESDITGLRMLPKQSTAESVNERPPSPLPFGV